MLRIVYALPVVLAYKVEIVPHGSLRRSINIRRKWKSDKIYATVLPPARNADREFLDPDVSANVTRGQVKEQKKQTPHALTCFWIFAAAGLLIVASVASSRTAIRKDIEMGYTISSSKL